MDFILEGFRHAWHLVVTGDAEVFHAIFVTLSCSLSAVTLAALVAFPYGAWLGIHRREGQGLQVFLMRIGMFSPTVVIGLLVYALLSRRGVLGNLDLLYTQAAIVAGEFLLAFPLLCPVAVIATEVAECKRQFN